MIDWYESAKSFNNDTTSATFINPIAGGDSVQGRGGQRVQYKSIHFQGQIYCAPPLASPTNYAQDTLSIAIVYDAQPNTALATWSNVFFDTTGIGNAISPTNYSTKQRFKILRRWIIPTNRFIASAAGTINNIGAEQYNMPNEVYQFHKKLDLQLSSTWTSTTGTIGSIMTGAFYVMTRSTTFNLASSPWFLEYSTRIAYTDDIPGV